METLTAKEVFRLFVFTDLDDTLFESLKGELAEFSIPATVDSNGQIYSYSSVQQQKLVNMMVLSGAVIIPVTGRRSSSFLNCKLPVVLSSEYAVVSHGAVILDDKHQLLDDWLVFLEQRFNLKSWQKSLNALYHKLFNHFETLQSGVKVRLIVDKGITAYICIKINKENYQQGKSRKVNEFLLSVLFDGMLLHGNARNFAILPPYARKKIAVDFLKVKMNIGVLDTVLGIGDSHSDLPFMSNSDFLIVPKQAQILKKGSDNETTVAR